MAEINVGNVYPVQAPNYSNLGNLYAQAGTDPSMFLKAYLQARDAKTSNDIKQQQLIAAKRENAMAEGTDEGGSAGGAGEALKESVGMSRSMEGGGGRSSGGGGGRGSAGINPILANYAAQTGDREMMLGLAGLGPLAESMQKLKGPGKGGGGYMIKIPTQKDKRDVGEKALSISQMKEEDKEKAYYQTTADLVQQGKLKASDVPDWNAGGRELANTLAKDHASRLVAEMNGGQLDAYGRKPSTAKGSSSASANKGFSGSDAKYLGLMASAGKALDNLERIMPQASKTDLLLGTYAPRWMQTNLAQQYEDNKLFASEGFGRVNSGAVIGAKGDATSEVAEGEQKRFYNMLPRWSDTPEAQVEKMKLARIEFQSMKDAMLKPRSETVEDHSSNSGYAAAQQQYPGLTKEQYQQAGGD